MIPIHITQMTVPFVFSVPLAERGYPQSASNFYWIRNNDEVRISHSDALNAAIDAGKALEYQILCAAPLAEELLQFIPKGYYLRETEEGLLVYKDSSIVVGKSTRIADITPSKTIAEALGRTLLFVIDSGEGVTWS